MIRPMTEADSAAVLTLTVAAGLFPASETDGLAAIIASSFAGELGDGHRWIADERDGTICGAAYYAPEQMADRTWDLYISPCGQQTSGVASGRR